MTDAPLLSHQRVTESDETPDRWLAVLHGLYGSGRNWSSVTRRVIRQCEGWGGLLVDLRQHGESMGFPPPHTMEAAAGDVAELEEAEGLDVRAVVGHSLGGKIALLQTRETPDLEQVWVVDSPPGEGEVEGAPVRMIDILRSNPGPFEEREGGVEALEDEGLPTPVARWMSTNLVRRDDAYVWRIDPDDMEAMLESFLETDAWDVVESPPEGTHVHMVKALDSDALDEEACRRIEEAGERTGRVHLHRLEGGHWLNADNPDRLVELLTEWL